MKSGSVWTSCSRYPRSRDGDPVFWWSHFPFRMVPGTCSNWKSSRMSRCTSRTFIFAAGGPERSYPHSACAYSGSGTAMKTPFWTASCWRLLTSASSSGPSSSHSMSLSNRSRPSRAYRLWSERCSSGRTWYVYDFHSPQNLVHGFQILWWSGPRRIACIGRGWWSKNMSSRPRFQNIMCQILPC